MISKIIGTVTKKKDKKVEIKMQAGFFFEFLTPHENLFHLTQECEVYIFMHFSNEKGYVMYGFFDELTKIYFKELQECHGIGPKIALLILEKISLRTIYQAIVNENKSVFVGIPGIGQKKAELLFIQLKSVIKSFPVEEEADVELFSESHQEVINDLEEVLLKVGLQKHEVKKIVKKLFLDKSAYELSLAELVSLAFQA